MIRFYWSLLREVPGLLFSAVDRFLKIIGALSFLLVLFNQELAGIIQTAWEGIPRWWATLPVSLLFLYLLLQANYARFQKALASKQRTAPDEVEQTIGYLKWEIVRSEDGKSMDLAQAFLKVREILLVELALFDAEAKATSSLQLGNMHIDELKRMFGHFHALGLTETEEREFVFRPGGSKRNLTVVRLTRLGSLVLQRLITD